MTEFHPEDEYAWVRLSWEGSTFRGQLDVLVGIYRPAFPNETSQADIEAMYIRRAKHRARVLLGAFPSIDIKGVVTPTTITNAPKDDYDNT